MVNNMTYNNIKVTKVMNKLTGDEGRLFYLHVAYPECDDAIAYIVDKDYIENDECASYCCTIVSRKGTTFKVYLDTETLEYLTVKC